MEKTQKEQLTENILWLSRYREAFRKEYVCAQDLEKARGAVLCHAPAVDGMPRCSGYRDNVGREAERLMKAETCYANAVSASRKILQEVKWAISTVRNANQREILRRRYLLGQTLTVISEQMHLEYRWVRRLHQKAVLSVVTSWPGQKESNA